MTQAQLKNLSSLLTKLDKQSMPIPTLHGYLSAIVIGPELIQPSEWLPFVFNQEGEKPEFDSMDDANQVIGTIMNFYNSIIQDLDADRYKPIFTISQRSNSNDADPKEWCTGFAEGVALSEESWFDNADKGLYNLIMPIYYFVDGADFNLPDEGQRKEEEFKASMIALIPKAVLALRKYWRKKIYGVEQSESEGRIVPFGNGPKKEPGRNDPCPCGSGKKYKNCCGGK